MVTSCPPIITPKPLNPICTRSRRRVAFGPLIAADAVAVLPSTVHEIVCPEKADLSVSFTTEHVPIPEGKTAVLPILKESLAEARPLQHNHYKLAMSAGAAARAIVNAGGAA